MQWNISKFLKLYLVIGTSNCPPGTNLTGLVRDAVDGGVTSVQLREKHATESEVYALAEELQAVLPPEIPLIINDYVGIAKKLRLPVHVGQSDLPCEMVRELMGPDAIVGLSIENVRQAKESKGCGASYYGVGPIFTTGSKHDAAPPIGVDGLEAIANILDAPCVGIGGINGDNADQVYQYFEGVAVISAITNDPDPEAAARALLPALNSTCRS